jgi:hypothetical protein
MKRESLTKFPSYPFIGLPAEQKCYDEVIDLLARGASPAELVAFHPSEEVQERVRFLLLRNSAGELTDEEAAELDRIGELEHFMQLVKARAQHYLKRKT